VSIVPDVVPPFCIGLFHIFGVIVRIQAKTRSIYCDLLYLFVFFRKALESLAGRESGEPQRVREHAQREMAALRDAFNKRIVDLEQVIENYLLSYSL